MSGRKGWVAVALSLAIPGLGHVYAGFFGVALALGLVDRLVPVALELAAGLGLVSVKGLAVAKLGAPVVMRVAAAALAVSAARQGEPQVAPGVYGFFAVGWVVLAFALGGATGALVSAVPLTEGAHGLRPADRVFTTRMGPAAAPQPGALAVWFEDWPDGGANPIVPMLRQVKVSRVTRATPEGFELEGRDAGVVPLDDYGGLPLGVLSAPSGQGLDWDRIGVVPTP